MAFRRVLIIADIEGSSECFNYEASSFKTASWPAACLGMTRDIKAVTDALLESGVESIIVKDFHRTGYNVMKEHLDSRVQLVSGYQYGPVPGLGDPGNSEALMMTGMHAPSGSNGFLAHTLTSRISKLMVNDEPVSEAQIFSASLAQWNIAPVFFSACPVGCAQASEKLTGINTWSIDKSGGPGSLYTESWRTGLSEAAVSSLTINGIQPYQMKGPFDVSITMRDGEEVAAKLARRWKLSYRNASLFFSSDSFDEFYQTLIRLCYLTPLIEKIAPAALPLYNFYGAMGLNWARRHLKVS